MRSDLDRLADQAQTAGTDLRVLSRQGEGPLTPAEQEDAREIVESFRAVADRLERRLPARIPVMR